MNLLRKDYRSLSRLQDKFLLHWEELDMPFYLTGGTALGRYYLGHRYSEDLDFFINADPGFSTLILSLKNNLQQSFKIDVAKIVVTDDFARFFIEEENLFLKIEFVNDVPFRVGKPLRKNKLLIDSVSNILANKLTAIVSRDEPRDVFDIVSVSLSYSFNWAKVFSYAKEKAMVNEIDVAQRLNDFPVEMLKSIAWLSKPPGLKSFGKNLKQIADDFILGRDNSLGFNKINLNKAKIL